MRLIKVLFLVLTGILAIQPELAATPVNAQEDTRIVFVSDKDGGRNLYVMNADGSNVQQLTSGSVENTEPVWSPDRRQIAFSSNRDGDTFEIYVMNADGSNVRRLTNNSGATYNGKPSWSPDGQHIAFVSNQSGKQDIFVLDVRDGKAQQLTKDPNAQADMPAWSPDGQHIAYASDLNGHFDIFVMNPDGSHARPLTHETQADSDSPAWSPDGRQIAFTANHSGNSDLFLINSADGSNRSQIVSIDGYFMGSPAWSPDGKSIAFMAWQPNKDRIIRVVDVNGGSASVRQITEGGDHAGWPSWASPKPIAPSVSNVGNAPVSSACSGNVDKAFAKAWADVKSRIGCPRKQVTDTFADQNYEHGKMIWRGMKTDATQGGLGTILVMFDDATWQIIKSAAFVPGKDPTDSCPSTKAPPGKKKPVRGFNKLWCNDSDLRSRLGFATDIERGYVWGVFTAFDNGFMVFNYEGRALIFYYGESQSAGNWEDGRR